MNNIDGGFPVYILDDDTIVYIEKDCDHLTFWNNTVKYLVSKKFNVSLQEIENLPYCQRRARVVGSRIYCGENVSKKLLKKIEKILKMNLILCFDEHESRCPISVSEFKGLKI